MKNSVFAPLSKGFGIALEHYTTFGPCCEIYHFSFFTLPCIFIVFQFNHYFQIDEAADVIQKLHLIAQELPSGK